MAKAKESKTNYATEHVTIVTAQGQTKIPRALRARYHVAPKSRLRLIDTGEGLLVVPLERMTPQPNGKKSRGKAKPRTTPDNLQAIAILRDWMRQPDDWTTEQWDEFEKELKENRLKFRDVEI